MERDVTENKLYELRGISHWNGKSGLSEIKIGKKITKTEKEVFDRYEDETDLGPFSKVLLYGKNIPYSKNDHKALIKLIKRGWFKVFEIQSEEYPNGFTYILKKERNR